MNALEKTPIAGECNETTSSATLPKIVLFVDDEPQILSSLKRLARRFGYQALTANGGQEALQVLAQSDVDIVVSDMRMPEMTGAQFLEHAAQSHPATMRILLTGYSDIESAISAVNKGQIFRYLNKPWQDDELGSVLNQAMEIRHLAREKTRLEALTQRQNQELSSLNASLEQKVEERTHQVQEAAKLLANANRDLRQSYATTVEIFASLIQLSSRSRKNTRDLAERARATAAALGLSEEQQGNVRLAGLLCDLGKLALPDEICDQPYVALSAEQRARFHEHPAISESTLLPLPVLEPVARILRQHCEHVDGTGYPDGLRGEELSTESKVLAVVKDFDALTSGLLLKDSLTISEALKYLSDHGGSRYDPDVVAAFRSVESSIEDRTALSERRASIAGLEPGLTVTRDFYNKHGVLVLPAGLVLTQQTIARLERIARTQHDDPVIHVSNQE